MVYENPQNLQEIGISYHLEFYIHEHGCPQQVWVLTYCSQYILCIRASIYLLSQIISK